MLAFRKLGGGSWKLGHRPLRIVWAHSARVLFITCGRLDLGIFPSRWARWKAPLMEGSRHFGPFVWDIQPRKGL